MKKKNAILDICVIGFALFSMFFGAGNVIFPPYLGMAAGTQWLIGFVCYYIADIGLALLTLFAMLRHSGSEGIVEPLGKIPSTILMTVIVLCIGPMLAIPRTAATTYEMSVQPIIQSFTDGNFAIVCSIVFFLITFLLTVRQSAVVDIIGKFLTPALVIGLLILIIKGIISPLGPLSPNQQVDSVSAMGIQSGYQTMDVLATMLFGVMILNSAEEKGYTTLKEKNKVSIGAGAVAGALLLIVYCGLAYLGGTVSTMYDTSIPRATLVSNIVYALMGKAGTIIFGIVVALACLTTAIGLISTCAEFFTKLFNGKISYPILVTILCVFSAVVSNVGLDKLVAIAAPLLDLVYPPTLVLVALSFFKNIPNLAHRLGAIAALAVSGVGAVCSVAGLEIPAFIKSLPLGEMGFAWLVPAVIFAVIGLVIGRALDSKKAIA